MKSHPLTLALVAVACVGALVAAVLALTHVLSARELSRLQFQVNMVNRYHAIAQSLANDAAEYSKRNPAINEVLQLVTKPRGAAAAPAGGQVPVPAPSVPPSGK